MSLDAKTAPGRPRVTVLTPPGRGAIGVVQVWGRGAVEASDAAFRPARGPGLVETPPGRLRLGRLGRGAGDEVVAVVLAGEPPRVEIQCHGGPIAVDLVVEALCGAGATIAPPEEWTESCAESPIRAEALVDLTRASTIRTAEILLEQAQGALDRELQELAREIDQGAHDAINRVDRLIERGSVGVRLLPGWKVVIAGRPNVGKSRLLNALAGYQRAIVDPTPGTTRDVVSARVSLDGWPIELLDTAGLRPTDDAIERSGIERAHRQQASADVMIKVLARSEPLSAEDLAWAVEPGPSLLVASKADLPAAWGDGRLDLTPGTLIVASAETGEGIDRLIAEIVARLVPRPAEPGAGVPFREGHVRCLVNARNGWEGGDRAYAARSIRSMLGYTSRPAPDNFADGEAE
jgi:tRNA modification GTPase